MKIQALIDNPNRGSGVKKHDVGIVKSFNNVGNPYMVDFPNNHNYYVSTKTPGRYKILTDEEAELLEEAQRRFLPGTKFFPAHIDPAANNEYCIVSNNGFYFHGKDIYNNTDDDKKWDKKGKNGNVDYNRIIYDGNEKRWATIITNQTSSAKYKVGDEIKSVKGGWQYTEDRINKPYALNHLSSEYKQISGKCTKVEWSDVNQCWWYKIDDYPNMFTENSVELVEQDEFSRFKKGDYVVLLSSCTGKNSWKESIPENYCYKLREDLKINNFHVEKDIKGSLTNGWSCLSAKGRGLDKLKVRAATKEEIAEYDRLDKPFDVSSLSIKKDDKNRVLKTFEVGKWYTNPLRHYELHNGKKAKYFRVSSCEPKYSQYANCWFNDIKFDKLADEDWNMFDISITQSNPDFDQQMVLIEPPLPKEETLVLGQYKIGDVVVSLENIEPYRKIGDMFTVLEKSTKNALYYSQHTNSDKKDSWRPATEEEKQAYKNGIRNISSIKKEDVNRPSCKKKVSELKYPDVIHIRNEEDYKRLVSSGVKLKDYNNNFNYYLVEAKGCNQFFYSGNSYENTPYINYEMEDLIFEEKTITYEKGKWYKLKASHIDDERWFLKLLNENESSYEGEYIDKTNQIYENNGIFYKEYNTLIPLEDLSEIQPYLPDGHPDKNRNVHQLTSTSDSGIIWIEGYNKYMIDKGLETHKKIEKEVNKPKKIEPIIQQVKTIKIFNKN